MFKTIDISRKFDLNEVAVVYAGDCMDLMREIPDESIQLVVTSPPYNLGKEYEQRQNLREYLEQQAAVIAECYRIMKSTGSICWQVGNYVDNSSIIPLDTILYPIFRDLGLKMRNRIVWHFEHGLHASKRFSGRYETINWYTKSDEYVFNLDPVRVAQKYPGKKYFKGPKKGQYSSNPLGKNPGDMWIFPNVKSNHVEKTIHPCQFPVELVERLVLSMTNMDDWVFDPFLGVGTTIIAALRNERRGAGSEIVRKYVDIAHARILQSINGTLPVRPMTQPVFDPKHAGKSLTTAPWASHREQKQLTLMDRSKRKYRAKK
ncbi:MAG: site-specific DNA-methyltransferase [Bacteroidota bacterium]|jgi:adenine-specific DNA-methyltransferase